MEKITHESSTSVPTVDLSSSMDNGFRYWRPINAIPTVDLSPFFKEDKAAISGQKRAMEIISEACTNLGVFYIKNHGVPLNQCEKLLKLTKTFFSYPDEKKKSSTENDNCISGAGYGKMYDKYHDYEYLLMYSPGMPHNGVPTIQSDYRETFEKVFKYMVNTAQLLEDIINDCLGLPPNFLHTYNNDRKEDYMFPMHYTRGDQTKHIGIDKHQDPHFLTITLQDNVSGLQVWDDGKWTTTRPTKDKLVVVVDDLVQVLSNKKYRHVTHRAYKNPKKERLAIDFCYNFSHDKWIEPLRLVPEDIRVKPKYRGFMFKEYMDMITENYQNPPPRVEDFNDITYYEI